MKILNLYAGIGGNRKLWNGDIEVTAIEINKYIAEVYKDFYSNDNVVIGDAKEYLLQNYKNYDFIWASPPCQSHSRLRKIKVDCKPNPKNSFKAIYPDMSLYQIILFLQTHLKEHQKFVVENVNPYYKPLINSTVKLHRHLYWSNFNIPFKEFKTDIKIESIQGNHKVFGTSIRGYKLPELSKKQILRNMVNPEIGKYIFDCLKN